MADANYLKSLDDEQLVELCNAGGDDGRRAFDTLYVRHKDYVVAIASKFTNDNSVVLDALQETFIYLLGRFPPSGDGLTLTAKLSTYLYPIARNACITQLRKRGSASAVDPDSLPFEMDTPDDDLHTILKELPPSGREILTLRFIHGFSLQEAAEALDIPLGTAKSRLHHAVSHLRKSSKIKRFFDK